MSEGGERLRKKEENMRRQKRRRCDEALEGYVYNNSSSSRDETEVMVFITAQ